MATRKTKEPKAAAAEPEKTAEPTTALAALPDFLRPEDLGAGLEEVDAESLAIPFLRVLQKLSPQVDEAHAAYVEGARGGMLYNSVSGKLYDGKEGVTLLFCHFNRRFLIWGARDAGGGYKGERDAEEVAQMLDKGQLINVENGLYVPDENGEVNPRKSDRAVDTRSHYALVVEPDGKLSPVLLSLAKTQIRKSKQLMAMLSEVMLRGEGGKMIKPPTWVTRVRVTTVPESNDQGSWYGVKFESEGFITDAEQYEAGKAFHDAVAEGRLKANFAAEETEDGAPPADKF